jgi:protein-disulfide isomerase
MSRRAPALFALSALAIFCGAQPGFAQPTDEMKNLRQEMEALKESQKAIQSDLQEIKSLLRGRLGAAAAPPQETILNIDGAPFKGDKNAKVTLVEFTDYQ